MADGLFTEEEIKASQDAMLNDPRLMTIMVAPDGSTFKALPQHVDRFISEGSRPLNPESTWEVREDPTSEFIQKVKARDLPDYVKRGYSTNKLGEYERSQREQAEYQQGLAEGVTTSAAEKALGGISALTAGITGGATDVLGRTANELIGLAQGDDTYAARAAEDIRSIRDSSVAYSGLELLGTLGTGFMTGGLTAGMAGSAKVAAMAAEGALKSASSLAARQVGLGDENITAESYLWAAGLGAGLGGFAGGLSNYFGKTAARNAARGVIDDVPIEMSLKPLSTTTEALNDTVVPIIHKGNIVGKVTLSRAAEGYHPGTRGSGITLEALELADDAPKDTAVNVYRHLAGEFGSVSSPSNMANLTSVNDDFMNFGSRHLTRDGNAWYKITPDTIPQSTEDSAAVLNAARRFKELVGIAPQKGTREGDLFYKFYDPNNGIFRRGFLDFAADQDKAISSLYKDFKSVQDMMQKQIIAAEAVRGEIGSMVTAKGALAMNNKLYKAQRSMLRDAFKLENIPTEDAKYAAYKLKQVVQDIEGIVTTPNPTEAWRSLLLKKREFGELLKTATKDGAASEIRTAYNNVYGQLNKALKSDKVIGKTGAELFNDLDKSATNSIKTSDEFLKAFAKRDAAGKLQVDETKISQAYNAIRAGTRAGKLTILDSYAADATDFANSVKRAQEAGFIKNIELPDVKNIMPSLNKVNLYREYVEGSRVLAGLSKGNFLTQTLQSMAATAGSLGGYAAGGVIGGTILGGGAAALTRLPQDATAALKLASRAGQGLDKITNLTDKLADFGRFGIKKSVNPIGRRVIIAKLRAAPYTTNEEYVDNVKQRLNELNGTVDSVTGMTGNPMLDDAMARSAKRAYDYALSQIPQGRGFGRVSNTDASKVDKVLYALTQPFQALEKAVYENDTDIIQHVQAMFPLPFEMFQRQVMDKIAMDDKMSYQTRLRLQRLVGVPYAKTSKGAVALARSVYSNPQQESGKAPQLSSPELPTGANIQDF